MADNVTRFPGPKPTPLRSVSLDELFNDAPRMPKEERQAAVRWALEEVDRAMSALKSARKALEMMEEGE